MAKKKIVKKATTKKKAVKKTAKKSKATVKKVVKKTTAKKVSKKKVDKKSPKIIVCDPKKCTGCKICEYACSLVNEKNHNIRLSRITTIRVHPVHNASMSCVFCDDPECVKGCPTSAIWKDEKKKHIVIDKEKCVGCGYCNERCPYGSIHINPAKKIAVVCDFCKENNKGKPACVDYCPKEALTYEQAKDGSFQDLIQKSKTWLIEDMVLEQEKVMQEGADMIEKDKKAKAKKENAKK